MDKQTLSNLIPVLTFVLILGLILFGLGIWKKWLSPRTKIIKQRIQEITESNSRGSPELLIHKVDANTRPWLRALRMKLPFTERLRLMIIRADINKTLEDILLIIIAFNISGFFLLSLTSLPIWMAGIGGLASGLIPILYLHYKGNKRRFLFEKQLPEALGFLARSLKAGHGLTIAMSMLADDAPYPMGKDMKIAVDQLNFGLAFDETLNICLYG